MHMADAAAKKRKRRLVYPGVKEAEQQRPPFPNKRKEEPDWIGNAPNYDKFHGWTPEEVLVYLNID